jgi:hypothetical protein
MPRAAASLTVGGADPDLIASMMTVEIAYSLLNDFEFHLGAGICDKARLLQAGVMFNCLL